MPRGPPERASSSLRTRTPGQGPGGFGSALKADPAGVRPPGSRRRGTRRGRRRRCGAGGHRDGVSAPPGAPVRPLPREDPAARPGALALEAVRAARFPGGRCCYAWVAGEAGLATGVRRHLVGERGVARADVTFRGYFRHGRAALRPGGRPPLTSRAARPGTAGPRPARRPAGRSGRGGPRR
ncbi:hypothetical protein D0C37_13055 [Streptomyces koyangensis]|uniref:SIP-like Rossmann fold domain-containing protein n=1 Tax=Streptomyces koyangensis TaxID=188770 RepID=A0A385DAH3_9ACTN|nr:hypothetical protein D0C37_13055 [Streptomyces koyangensis]